MKHIQALSKKDTGKSKQSFGPVEGQFDLGPIDIQFVIALITAMATKKAASG